MNNFQHCAALVHEADRDRYLATLFAPAEHRDGLHALYAFNIEISRMRDLAREPLPGEIRLQWWREAISGERAEEAAAHPVVAALRETLQRYGIPAARLAALIDAHEFDLYDEPMPTVADLEIYAIKAQSTVFAVAGEILGARGPASDLVTLDTGIAYAITGILQALPRHAARHQLYLPLDTLKRRRVEANELFAGQVSDGLRAALADLRALARKHLAQAQAKLDGAPPEILPALLPAASVGASLRSMDRPRYEPLQIRPLPPWRRQWLLWRAARDPGRILQA